MEICVPPELRLCLLQEAPLDKPLSALSALTSQVPPHLVLNHTGGTHFDLLEAGALFTAHFRADKPVRHVGHLVGRGEAEGSLQAGPGLRGCRERAFKLVWSR